MAEFASKGVAGAGLGTGIAGLTLGVLNSGLLGGGYNYGAAPVAANAAMYAGDHFVSEKEMHYIDKLNEERMKNAILTSEQNTEIKIADVYERLAKKINDNQREQDEINRNQAVYNGVNTTIVNDLKGQIRILQSLTKVIIPNESVVPGWDDAT